LRLEIHRERNSFRHVWTYGKKRDTDDPDLREELEETIDLEKLASGQYPPDEFPKLLELREGIEALQDYPCVIKTRTILADDEEKEVVFDEFLHPDDVSAMIEIELKSLELPDATFEKTLSEFGLSDCVEEITRRQTSKNRDLAKKREPDVKNPVHSLILTLQNRLKGPVIVAVLQGKSLESNIEKAIRAESSQNNVKANISDLTYPYEKYGETEFKPKGRTYGIPIKEILDLEAEAPLAHECVRGLSAELDSLFAIEKNGYEIDEVRYFLFPEKDGAFEDEKNRCPKLYPYLKKLTQRVFHNVTVSSYSHSYAANDPESVYRSFKETWQAFEGLERNNGGREIVFDSTGGHKIIGIIAALYFQFSKKPFYYVQADSDVLYKFPPAPINWDILQIDESHAFYRQINGNRISYVQYLQVPQPLRNIFNSIAPEPKEAEPILTSLPIDRILSKYEDSRKVPFGYGEEFLDFLDDEKRKAWIRDKILSRWSLQWMGDQIPETVEHSQRHSKRLMEFTVNLINTIGEETFLKGIPRTHIKDFYFILAIAMNIHDLGHTNNLWRFGNGQVLHLDGLPNIVRDLHNELTVQMIDGSDEDQRFRLLEGLEEFDPTGDIKKALVLVSRYHRGHMPIDRPAAVEKTLDKDFVSIFELHCPPLADVCEEVFPGKPEWRAMVIALARWLKFIDGTDVQADRTLIPEYSKIRCERTKYESLELIEELLRFPNPCIALNGLKSKLLAAKRQLKLYNPDHCDASISTNLDDIGKTLEKTVYETVADAIYSANGNPRISISYDIRTLARIAFKIRQFVHFETHNAIEVVFPRFFKEKTLAKRGDESKTKMLFLNYVLRGDQSQALLESVKSKVKKDVEEEFKKAGICKLQGIEHLEVEFYEQPSSNPE